MTTYHISINGDAVICTADQKTCPRGGHAPTAKESRQIYEQEMKALQLPKNLKKETKTPKTEQKLSETLKEVNTSIDRYHNGTLTADELAKKLSEAETNLIMKSQNDVLNGLEKDCYDTVDIAKINELIANKEFMETHNAALSHDLKTQLTESLEEIPINSIQLEKQDDNSVILRDANGQDIAAVNCTMHSYTRGAKTYYQARVNFATVSKNEDDYAYENLSVYFDLKNKEDLANKKLAKINEAIQDGTFLSETNNNPRLLTHDKNYGGLVSNAEVDALNTYSLATSVIPAINNLISTKAKTLPTDRNFDEMGEIGNGNVGINRYDFMRNKGFENVSRNFDGYLNGVVKRAAEGPKYRYAKNGFFARPYTGVHRLRDALVIGKANSINKDIAVDEHQRGTASAMRFKVVDDALPAKMPDNISTDITTIKSYNNGVRNFTKNMGFMDADGSIKNDPGDDLVGFYTQENNYHKLNDYISGKGIDTISTHYESDNAVRAVEWSNEALHSDKWSSDKPHEFYRVGSLGKSSRENNAVDHGYNPSAIKVGNIVETTSLISTSLTKKDSDDYLENINKTTKTSDEGARKYQMRIITRKAMNISNSSQYEYENEVLLPKGMKLQCVENTVDQDGVYHMTMLEVE